MSRYVSVAIEGFALDEVAHGLDKLGLSVERSEMPGEQVMLEGSLECAGEPVDLRLPPGTVGAVEDFGFVVRDGAIALVCGDVDRRLLERELVGPLRGQVVEARARQIAAQTGAKVDVEVERDGTRRIKLRRS